MLKQAVNRLQGQVRVRVECAFPERVLNLCGARNLAFWDLVWESPAAFTCRLSRRDWKKLRRAAKQLECTLTVLEQEGVPSFLGRFRKRHAMAAGLLVCGLGLFLGSFFIWDFQVEGCQSVTREEVLRSLRSYGIHLGTFGYDLDGEDIRNHVLLDLPELSWVSVNVSGCRAYVQVRERTPAPDLLDKRQAANLVARRDGLVLKVRSLGGVACVLPGASVEKNQILISGVEDTETFGARLRAGMGRVTARTWYTLSTVMPLTAAEKRYTGETHTCRSLILGTHRLKFFANSSIEGAEYDKITTRTPWTLFGLPLPVTLVTEEYRFFDTEETAVSQVEAEKQAEAVLTAYLHDLVDPYGTVRSTLCASRQRDDALIVTLTAECEEEIGEQMPIYTQAPDG